MKTCHDRFLIFVFALLLSGCLAGQTGPKSAKPKKPDVSDKSSIEAIAYAAFQSRDITASDMLDELANKIDKDEIKYDGPLQDELVKINTLSSNTKEAEKLGSMMAAKLQSGDKFDKAVAVKAIRDYSAGRRRYAIGKLAEQPAKAAKNPKK